MPQRLTRARAGDEDPCAAGCAQRLEISGGEVHGVHLGQLLPGQLRVGARGLQALAKRHDRALPGVVDEGERPARGRVALRGAHAHAQLAQALGGAPALVVFAQRSHQQGLAGQGGQLRRGYPSASGRLGEAVARMHHLAGPRDVLDAAELNPLDVPHHGYARPACTHPVSLTH